MSELWGFQSGQQQADETNLKMQMGQLALQQGAVDTQQKETNLKTSQLVLQRQQELMHRLSFMGSSGPGATGGSHTALDGLSDQMYQVAEAQFASGLYEAGASTADKAGKLQYNQAHVAELQSKQQSKVWSDAANALQDVHDPRSLQNAFIQFGIQHPEEAQSPQIKQLMMQLQGQPYDQSKIAAIRDAAISSKEKAETAAAQARAKASEATARRAEAQIPLEKARTDEAVARTAAIKKAGGQSQLPKSGDVNYVMQHIKTDFDVSLSDADASQARLEATQVAADALDIRAAHPAMTMKQALDQAYIARKAGGNLSGLKPIDKSIGGTPARSLPLPSDLSKLQENRWYVAPDSQGKLVPQLWDGSSFNTQESLTESEAKGDDADEYDDEDEGDDEPAQ